jgi:hypothetical protein
MGFVLTKAEQAYHYGEELTHYGVAGMKWGKRGAGAAGGLSATGPSRKDLRSMDKVARAENKAEVRKKSDERDATIEKARGELGSKRDALVAAKKTYKVEKKQIGKVAARRALDQSKEEFDKSWAVAQSPTRKEQNQAAVVGALAFAGQLAVGALLGA